VLFISLSVITYHLSFIAAVYGYSKFHCARYLIIAVPKFNCLLPRFLVIGLLLLARLFLHPGTYAKPLSPNPITTANYQPQPVSPQKTGKNIFSTGRPALVEEEHRFWYMYRQPKANNGYRRSCQRGRKKCSSIVTGCRSHFPDRKRILRSETLGLDSLIS